MKLKSRTCSLAGLSLFSLVISIADGAVNIINPLTGFTGDTQESFPAQPTTLVDSRLNVTFNCGGI